MTFIFFTIPAYGHLNPMLGVIKELVKKNNKVIVYNTVDFKDVIERTGAEFRPPPVAIKKIDFRLMKNAPVMARLNLWATELLFESIVNIVKQEKPDCLVHDSLSVWGKLIGLKTGIPTISLVPSMGLNYKVILSGIRHFIPDLQKLFGDPLGTFEIIRKYRSLYREIDVIPPFILDIFSNEEKLNIVFTSEYFQPKGESFGTNYKFVGPVIYKRDQTKLPQKMFKSGKPIIYIALGTIYNDDQQIYKLFIETFKNSRYQVFIATGKYFKSSIFGKMPENIYIDEYLPQLQILKKASLFISHAGMNSVNESLYFGVPLIMFPQIQEQRLNAARVEELGAGIYYKKNIVEKDKLIELVEKTLADGSFKNNAKTIGKTLKAAGGYKMAVKHILDYLQ